MRLKKYEKICFVATPYAMGFILTVGGLALVLSDARAPQGIIMLGSGLICTSLGCVCNLIVKIFGDK